MSTSMKTRKMGTPDESPQCAVESIASCLDILYSVSCEVRRPG
jgi:hypothetical protein